MTKNGTETTKWGIQLNTDMKRSLFAALVTAFLLASVARAATQRVSADELRRLQLADPTLVLIDVRDAKAFSQGHIQNALNIPAPDVLSANLPHGGPIVIYCSEDPCSLTTDAAQTLTSSGYKEVSILEGGFGAWLAKKYPAVTSETPRTAPIGRSSSTDETRRKVQDGTALVLDLRTPAQYAAGHLPGARTVPLEELKEAKAWLPKNKEIVVYDVASTRSKQAVRELAAEGFNASELNGGVAGWVRKGLPLEIK